MSTVVPSRTYTLLALAMAALVFVGFTRTYYLRGLFDVPPITLLLHVHGIVFTAWVVLFVIQVWLISAHDYRAHMRLGMAGMAVAALVVIVGIASTVLSASGNRPRPMNMTSQQFVFIPLFAIVAFGALVAAAFAYRRQGAVHKRLMVMAMVVVLGPAVARILNLTGNGAHFLWIQTGVAACFMAWCLITDWTRHRALHPVYAIGGPLLVLSWPARAWVARTPAWEAVGRWLANL